MLPPHIAVHHSRLDRLAAVTDGHSTIWLDDRLTSVEQRCVLTHELVHLELSHVGHQPPAIEAKVRERTARWLVPLDQLWEVRHWQGPLHLLAEDPGITVAVLHDRLRWLTEEEELLRHLVYQELGGC